MADYPKELNLDSEAEERLIQYIDSEILNHRAERGDYINDLNEWQKDYWAKPSGETRTFPFQGAASIIIPISAITIEAVHSRTMTTLFALEQFVSVKARNTDWIDLARPLEQMLANELINNVKIYKPANDSVLELIKFGTGVLKCGYKKVVKTAVRELPDGTEEEFTVTTESGAEVTAVPVSRFMMPYAYQDQNTSPWCGQEHTASPVECRNLEYAGLFKEGTYGKIYNFYNPPMAVDEFKRNQQELEDKTPVMPKEITWCELWLSFDVARKRDLTREYGSAAFPPGGEDREIVVHYHPESRTIMSCRYNWYSDLRRPYYSDVYFPVEHRWTGVGACKQLDQFQLEITTQHRQRLDAGTLANTMMFKINKLSQYGPGEPIFPGKMWFLDSMDDIEPMYMSDVKASSFSNENQSLVYAQQRSGVNELNLGLPQAGTPGTATAELSRVQEGNKKFDFIYKNVKRLMSSVILDVTAQIRQFGPRNLEYYDYALNGDLVKKFFDMDETLIRQGLIVEIVAAGQQENKLIDRQNWQQVAQMIQQYYTSMIQMAQLSGNQQMVQAIIQHGLTAATEAMKQILDSFDLKSTDRIVVPEKLLNELIQPTQPGATTGLALPSPNAGVPSIQAPAQPTA